MLGQDGAPPLGWSDTIAYLVLPVLLVDDAASYSGMCHNLLTFDITEYVDGGLERVGNDFHRGSA
jgi:hypothetical protein